MVCCSITDMSGRTYTPPLKAAIGMVSWSGSTSIDMPRGGRPLVMAKSIPACLSFATAATARSVSTLSWVTSVPSTSARNSRMGGAMVPPVWFGSWSGEVWRSGRVSGSGRRTVGHHQGGGGLDAARRDRRIAGQEPGQWLLLVVTGDQPEDLPGPRQRRVGQRHPHPPLVRLGEGDQAIGDPQDRIVRYQRGGVPVGAETQVDKIEVLGQRGRVAGGRGHQIALVDRHGPHL